MPFVPSKLTHKSPLAAIWHVSLIAIEDAVLKYAK
jgi:hypothetical protein